MSKLVISGLVSRTISPGRNGTPRKLVVTRNGEIVPTKYSSSGVYVARGVDSAELLNRGTIKGGAGGRTSENGGVGVVLNGGRFSNNGAIAGGQGFYPGDFHSIGAGGNGFDLKGGMLVNNGSITGGAGGSLLYTYRYGEGGAGVFLKHGMLVNNGSITGGASGTYASLYGSSAAGVYVAPEAIGVVLVNRVPSTAVLAASTLAARGPTGPQGGRVLISPAAP